MGDLLRNGLRKPRGRALPIIGALLGHTQAATTARYAHLLDEPLKEATEQAGAILSGKPSADEATIRGKP